MKKALLITAMLILASLPATSTATEEDSIDCVLNKLQAACKRVCAETKDREACDLGFPEMIQQRMQRRQAARDLAQKYMESLNCEAGKKLSETGAEDERPHFNFESCQAERKFEAVKKTRDPQALYLSAVRYESEGERSKAKTIYLLIMERFSTGPMAIKSADRLAALTDVQAIESSNSSREHATRQASQDAERRASDLKRSVERASSEAGSRAYQACRIEMDSCYSKGGKNCYRSCDALR